MASRQRSASDAFDVALDSQRIFDSLADKLVAPIRIADLRAVGLQVLHYLQLPHAAIDIHAKRVSNQFMLANDLIQKQPSDQFASGHGLPDERLRGSSRYSGKPFDFFDLRGCELKRLCDVLVGKGEDLLTRLFDGEVFCSDALRRHGVNGRGKQPADIRTHAVLCEGPGSIVNVAMASTWLSREHAALVLLCRGGPVGVLLFDVPRQ